MRTSSKRSLVALAIALLAVHFAFAQDNGSALPRYNASNENQVQAASKDIGGGVLAIKTIAVDASGNPLTGTTATISTPTLTSYFSEALSNTAVQIKASSATVYGFTIINTNPVPVYVHKYNSLSAGVTVGTTTQADAPWAVPANGFFFLPKNGLTHGTFATAFTIAATTSPFSNVSTAPATPLVISIGYQ